MPKQVDYPHASFKSVLEIAGAIDYLGGSCSMASCADKLNKKISGAFKALVSASIKHGLVTGKKELLNTTDLYRLYKLAYDDKEKTETLTKAFLFPPIYQKIYERFKGKELPISMLDKLLIRELGVDESYGSRVAGYFIDGAKSCNMLENGKLIDNIKINQSEEEEEVKQEESNNDFIKKETEVIQDNDKSKNNSSSYWITITGPGINAKIEINEADDLIIHEAMINKIKNKLKERE